MLSQKEQQSSGAHNPAQVQYLVSAFYANPMLNTFLQKKPLS